MTVDSRFRRFKPNEEALAEQAANPHEVWSANFLAACTSGKTEVSGPRTLAEFQCENPDILSVSLWIGSESPCASVEIHRQYGLVYTCNLGWLDLGHMNPLEIRPPRTTCAARRRWRLGNSGTHGRNTKELGMASNETLYFTHEDLFRVGNSTSSKLADVRPDEVTLIEINGTKTIVANNLGASVYNKQGFEDAELSRWVYEIKASTPLPIGLRLWKDPQVKGHFHVVPITNMPYQKYVGLLQELAIKCQKLFKKQRA